MPTVPAVWSREQLSGAATNIQNSQDAGAVRCENEGINLMPLASTPLQPPQIRFNLRHLGDSLKTADPSSIICTAWKRLTGRLGFRSGGFMKKVIAIVVVMLSMISMLHAADVPKP